VSHPKNAIIANLVEPSRFDPEHRIFSYPATKHFHLVVKIKMEYHFRSPCPAIFYYFLFSPENLEQQAI